jgi:hypothetical protein
MEVSSLIQLLWVAAMIGQAALVVVLLVKSVWKSFPVFTWYSGVSFSSAVFVYLVRNNRNLYFYSYWVLEAIGIVLGFAVVYEIFRHLFLMHDGLRKLANMFFGGALLLLLAVAAIALAKQSPAGFSNIGSAVLMLAMVTRFVEVGLLISLFLLSSAFGLHWRQQVFGIALGLGLFTAIELTSVAVRAQIGSLAQDLFAVVRISAFNISLLIWMGYLIAPERAGNQDDLPQPSQLEQWNQAVMELIRQ